MDKNSQITWCLNCCSAILPQFGHTPRDSNGYNIISSQISFSHLNGFGYDTKTRVKKKSFYHQSFLIFELSDCESMPCVNNGHDDVKFCYIRTSTRSKCVMHYVFSFHFTHVQHSDKITKGHLALLSILATKCSSKKQVIAKNLFWLW